MVSNRFLRGQPNLQQIFLHPARNFSSLETAILGVAPNCISMLPMILQGQNNDDIVFDTLFHRYSKSSKGEGLY